MPSYTDVQTLDAIVEMLVQAHRERTLRFWGDAFERDALADGHPAWHAKGYTLERTYTDGLTEEFVLVYEPQSSFTGRQRAVPVTKPHQGTVKATFQARYRYGTPGEVQIWFLQVINDHKPGYTSKIEYHPFSGKITYCVGSHHVGPFRAVSGPEKDQLVEHLQQDLPAGALKAFTDVLVHA